MPNTPSAQHRPLLAANWKMHGSRAFAADLLSAIGGGFGIEHRAQESEPALAASAAPEIVICPPFVYLQQAAALLDATGITLGAQDLATHAEGAFTGEVSGAMLADAGCAYVIVGHSERRALYHESDEVVAAKLVAAAAAGLRPILCVGETLAEREQQRTEEVIARQLGALDAPAVRTALPPDAPPPSLVIAYEPVWAIGSGRTATPEQVRCVHAFIRERLAARFDGTPPCVIYGGSVKPDNAKALFAEPGVDGALVGGASLKADDFLAICKAL